MKATRAQLRFLRRLKIKHSARITRERAARIITKLIKSL